ncbi:hypothetical protein M445_01455 [Vibrio owensii 47666-1]|uniref:AAA family ATPase n=1 Tax=Vibrio owensii TaxID=696485 RepID=UPI0005849596|nr:ATP-binding protein [Vibrio owensii]KIF49527.1 hypothetical protein M445_01455 [Vibrio owensii 47666-1]
MLSSIEIANFKSIEDLTINLGRINVFIGENGSGKSTILEALTMAALADSNKLEDEFLESRGVRTTSPELMRSIFEKDKSSEPIEINIERIEVSRGFKRKFSITNTNEHYSQWKLKQTTNICHTDDGSIKEERRFPVEKYLPLMGIVGKFLTDFEDTDAAKKMLEDMKNSSNKEMPSSFTKLLESILEDEASKEATLRAYDKLEDFTDKFENFFEDIKGFAIYSPQNEQLRDLVRESKLKPLGIYGEGLFKLLKIIQLEEAEAYQDIIRGLNLIGWFKSIQLPDELDATGEDLKIQDKHLALPFNLRSANEGFLYVLFYMALIVSKDTPKIFAIDNIDAALNPKLCAKIMSFLCELAKKYDKQIFLTTQNSAVLDGLNLSDDEQRLLVVSRGSKGKKAGRTTVKQLKVEDKPRDLDGAPLPLSEAMLRGYIGGIPKGF